MWIFTRIGFFSAVRADPARIDGLPTDEPYVMVRARVREDLVNLIALWHECYEGEGEPEILAWKNRDYPYRVIIPQEEWVLLTASLAEDIDYGNFKGEVKKAQGYERSSLYMGVWSTMNGAERKLTQKKKGKRGKGRGTRSARRGVGQSSLDRWFERHGYDPHGVDLGYDDEAPMPELLSGNPLPEGTNRVLEPEESEPELVVETIDLTNEG